MGCGLHQGPEASQNRVQTQCYSAWTAAQSRGNSQSSREGDWESPEEPHWDALPAEAPRPPHPDRAWGLWLSLPFKQAPSRGRHTWVAALWSGGKLRAGCPEAPAALSRRWPERPGPSRSGKAVTRALPSRPSRVYLCGPPERKGGLQPCKQQRTKFCQQPE